MVREKRSFSIDLPLVLKCQLKVRVHKGSAAVFQIHRGDKAISSLDDLLCPFRLEPTSGFTVDDAAGRVASESSVGTWADMKT